MDFVQSHTKECPVCHKEYTAKRTDAIFCSATCKAFHNNHKNHAQKSANRTAVQITDPINATLWKNREILQKFEGKVVDMEDLKRLGFTIQYITRFDQDTKNRNVLYCYDFAYIFVDKSKIEIFRP